METQYKIEMEKKMKNLCNLCKTNTGREWGYVQYVQYVDGSDTIEKKKKFLCDVCHTEFAIKTKKWGK
jgi:hypothetical protein